MSRGATEVPLSRRSSSIDSINIITGLFINDSGIVVSGFLEILKIMLLFKCIPVRAFKSKYRSQALLYSRIVIDAVVLISIKA